jgi:GNAT acetyltransferase-like protein
MIGLDGPFFRGLLEVINRRDVPFLLTQSWNRALLERRADGEAYLQETLPGKSRKEFRRLERRLSELGRLEMIEAGPADTGAWIAAFLELEAKGWKGERGTALASTAEGRRYFAQVTEAAAAAGRLMMLGLHLDGRPVALKCNFLAGEASFAFKIAFDEAHARFSPGVLLELENIRRFHDRHELRWMDSCAAPEHFMANRLWMERRTLGTLLVATGGFPRDLIVSSLPLLRWLSRKLRRGPAGSHEGGAVEDRTGEGGER